MIKKTSCYLTAALLATTLLAACGGTTDLDPPKKQIPENRIDPKKIYGECNHYNAYKERCDATPASHTFDKATRLSTAKFEGKKEDNPFMEVVGNLNTVLQPKYGNDAVNKRLQGQIGANKLNVVFEFDKWNANDNKPTKKDVPIMMWPSSAPKDGKVKVNLTKGADNGVYSKSVFQNATLYTTGPNTYSVVSAPSKISFPVTLPRDIEVNFEVRKASLQAEATVDNGGGVSMTGTVTGMIQRFSLEEAMTKLEKSCVTTHPDCMVVKDDDNSCRKLDENKCGKGVCPLVAGMICSREQKFLNDLGFKKNEMEAKLEITTTPIIIEDFE